MTRALAHAITKTHACGQVWSAATHTHTHTHTPSADVERVSDAIRAQCGSLLLTRLGFLSYINESKRCWASDACPVVHKEMNAAWRVSPHPLHTCKIKSPSFSLWSECEMSACVISECSVHRGKEMVSPPKMYADGG